MRHVILSTLLLATLSSTAVSSAATLRAGFFPPRICLTGTTTCPPSPIAVAL